MDSAAALPPGRLSGAAALFASATLFAVVSVLVKFASASYGQWYVSAVRFGLGAVLCLAVLAAGYRSYRPKLWPWLLARGAVGVAAMALSYAAIGATGPGRAVLLGNTYPLFVAVFGALAFGEPLRPRLAVSLACCLAGAACVVGDGSGADWRGDAMALGSALLSGLAVNIVRRLSAAGENPFAIYLFPCLFGLPLLAIAPAPPGGLAGPGLVPLFCLLGVGAGAFAAQALMARGYRTVAAGRGSVVFYWETGLTVALGALLAGERPNLRFFVGLALILAGLRVNQKS